MRAIAKGKYQEWLEADNLILEKILNEASKITTDRDKKLIELQELIKKKVESKSFFYLNFFHYLWHL